MNNDYSFNLVFKAILGWALLFIMASCGGGDDGNSTRMLTGTLSFNDNTDDTGYNYDKIEIGTVSSDQIIQINVKPEGFDTVLFLVDKSLVADPIFYEDYVAISDSGGSDITETLSYTTSTYGVFTLYITSYDAGETGAYTLEYAVLDQ